MIEILENCSIEWDKGRGVLYVHDKTTGATAVRICGLPQVGDSATLKYNQIDVTATEGMASVPGGEL